MFSNLKRFLLCLVAVIFATASIPTISYAVDRDFFSSNDILFYNGDAGCSIKNENGDIAIAGTDIAEKMFRFFTSTNFSGIGDKPFNAIQAAGALGNFQQESSMNPDTIETTGEGYGLAQWSYGRKQILLDLARELDKSWNDISVQMEMITRELNAGYGPSLLGEGFADVKTPKDASFIFQKVYEGAGTPMQANRDSAAIAYYEKFKDLVPSSSTGNANSACSTGVASGDFMDGDFILYNQCGQGVDKVTAWDVGSSLNECSTICVPTSIAMVIANMKDKTVTPNDIQAVAASANMNYMNPVGYANKVAEKYGLNFEYLEGDKQKDLARYKEIFDKGGLIVSLGSGQPPYIASPGAHAIVFRGITSDGKIRIANPSTYDYSGYGQPGRKDLIDIPAEDLFANTTFFNSGAASVAFYP